MVFFSVAKMLKFAKVLKSLGKISLIRKITILILQKLNKSKNCADIGLLDTALFQRCFLFYSSVTEFLFLSLGQKMTAAVVDNDSTEAKDQLLELDPDEAMASVGEASAKKQLAAPMTSTIGSVTLQFPLPEGSGQLFSSLPEWMVEDMADFALFSLQ